MLYVPRELLKKVNAKHDTKKRLRQKKKLNNHRNLKMLARSNF